MRFTVVFFLLSFAPQIYAQWISFPTAGIPRTKDGKANLTAPAPRGPDGKPDLSGLWTITDNKYLPNLGAAGAEISMTPWAQRLFDERQGNNGRDRPSAKCLPHSVTDFDALFQPRKIIQTPGVLLLLFETFHVFREVFTDGRQLPAHQDPAWFGYSVGKWDGDTLVVDTTGLSEQTWLDDGGHPHSDALHVTERFHRRDFGHMDVGLTIDDPKAYTKPWSVTIPWEYMPDTTLLDWVCENNKDAEHVVMK